MCQGGNKSSCVPNTVDLSSVWTFELQPLFAFVFYLAFYSAFSSSLCWNMHLYIVCDIWPLSDSSTSVTVWPKHVTQTELKLNWQCVVMVSLGPADSSAIKDTTKICLFFWNNALLCAEVAECWRRGRRRYPQRPVQILLLITQKKRNWNCICFKNMAAPCPSPSPQKREKPPRSAALVILYQLWLWLKNENRKKAQRMKGAVNFVF